jgi:hypothetical protein
MSRQTTLKRIRRVSGTVVGMLERVAEEGATVQFRLRGKQRSRLARTLVPLSEPLVGREVALVFEKGNPAKPIISGILQNEPAESRPVEAIVDGERIVLSAKNEIVLRCGKSSITLTRAGKVLIRGAYLLSRSSGVNRIKGGSVQIN